MPQKVKVHFDNGIVEIWSDGTVSFEEAKRTMDQVRHTLQTTGFDKLLLDASMEASSMSTVQLYDFFANNLPFKTNLAVVAPVETRTRRDLGFGVTVAYNRGYRIRMTTSREDALCTLTES